MNYKLFLNRLLLLVLPLITYHFLLITPVDAHILKTDGTIGAVLHIDPDDDPVANQQAGFFFEFKDTQNKFQPQNCNCTFSILENGTQIYSQPLFQSSAQPSLDNASVFYNFPKKDVYQIKIDGTPTNPGEFQKFSLVYDVRVDKEEAVATGTQPPVEENWFTTHIIHIIGIGILGLFLVGVIIKQRFVKKT